MNFDYNHFFFNLMNKKMLLKSDSNIICIQIVSMEYRSDIFVCIFSYADTDSHKSFMYPKYPSLLKCVHKQNVYM